MPELIQQKKEFLTQQAKSCLKRMTSDIIELSRIAHEYHQEFGYQEYIGWIGDLGLSRQQGERFLNVHEKFGDTLIMSVNDIQPTVLYLLAAPSTPESARQEAIEITESGEKLSVKETKELIEAHKLIDSLEKELTSARSMIPTEDIKAKIIDLEKKLEAERNKPAQVVEVVPDDYEESKSEVTRLVDEKGRLLNQIKRIKDAQSQEVTNQVNQKLKELEDDFILKNKQLDAVQGRIDVLRPTLESMERVAGALNACKTASKDIRHNLTNISITISDLFSDFEIPESEISGLLFLADEMAQGAVAFKRCLNDKNQTQIGE